MKGSKVSSYWTALVYVSDSETVQTSWGAFLDLLVCVSVPEKVTTHCVLALIYVYVSDPEKLQYEYLLGLICFRFKSWNGHKDWVLAHTYLLFSDPERLQESLSIYAALLVYVSEPEKVQGSVSSHLHLLVYVLIRARYKNPSVWLTCLRFRPWKRTRISEYLLRLCYLCFWPWKGEQELLRVTCFGACYPEKLYSKIFMAYIRFVFSWFIGGSDISRHIFVVHGLWSAWRLLHWIFYCGCWFSIVCFIFSILVVAMLFLLILWWCWCFCTFFAVAGAPRCLRAFSKKTNPKSPRLKKRRPKHSVVCDGNLNWNFTGEVILQVVCDSTLR